MACRSRARRVCRLAEVTLGTRIEIFGAGYIRRVPARPFAPKGRPWSRQGPAQGERGVRGRLLRCPHPPLSRGGWQPLPSHPLRGGRAGACTAWAGPGPVLAAGGSESERARGSSRRFSQGPPSSQGGPPSSQGRPFLASGKCIGWASAVPEFPSGGNPAPVCLRRRLVSHPLQRQDHCPQSQRGLPGDYPVAVRPG